MVTYTENGRTPVISTDNGLVARKPIIGRNRQSERELNMRAHEIPLEIIESAKRSADIWEMPMCIGRRKETLYSARGDEFLIRKYGNHGELGVHFVVLPDTYFS